ncbi:MAG: cation transporter [Actinobacteria bacterium]|nr:cation transporter [Actinomycetota bacterium]
MRTTRAFELPPDKAKANQRAIRLEWITIGYLVSAIFFIYITLGASQAMKAAWIEDILSLVPPISFLVASRVRHRPPSERYPFGLHRAVSVGYLCASLALAAMGLFILYDSVSKLAAFEHAPIGLVQPWGEPIWLGWFMIPALVYSAVPAVVLGRVKLPLARELHDKVLYADAKMNKADWLTAVAAMVGVIGIGLGLWWLDSLAAILISLDITHDGIKNLRTATADLMDERPTLIDSSALDPLPQRLRTELRSLDWVRDAAVRVREEGHVFFADIQVVPTSTEDLTSRLATVARRLMDLDWRLHDVVIMPAEKVEEERRADPARPDARTSS